MQGLADHVDALAARMAHVAFTLRSLAARVGGLDAVSWQSTAADRFRADLARVAAHLGEVADAAEHARAVLARHAGELRREGG